jgi:hypothetical protein
VNRGDTARWQTAHSLGDLGELTALFLEGQLSETPSHGGPPDPETGPLIPVLTEVNRAGFVTEQSQPGIPPDADGSAQRANVSGFASNKTFAALTATLADTDLVITAARARRDERACPQRSRSPWTWARSAPGTVGRRAAPTSSTTMARPATQTPSKRYATPGKSQSSTLNGVATTSSGLLSRASQPACTPDRQIMSLREGEDSACAWALVTLPALNG